VVNDIQDRIKKANEKEIADLVFSRPTFKIKYPD